MPRNAYANRGKQLKRPGGWAFPWISVVPSRFEDGLPVILDEAGNVGVVCDEMPIAGVVGTGSGTYGKEIGWAVLEHLPHVDGEYYMEQVQWTMATDQGSTMNHEKNTYRIV